jgi:hypothetical protein
LNLFIAGVRHRYGREPVDLLTAVPPPPPQFNMMGLNPGLSGGPAPVVKKIKVSTVMDQGSDMEVDLLPPDELAARRRVWFLAQGDHPREMQEVTDVQLSALARILEAGLNPKIDMGVWGPHGDRIERTNKFRAWISGPCGETGRYVEIPGASSLEQWSVCWEVYRTAMIMEQAASQATLDKYSGDFKEMAATYAPRGCWAICAQADIRCRSEYWPQLKRRMELFHQTSPQASVFEPARPWNSVIRESVGPSANSFWEQQLMGPARLFLIENGSKRPWAPSEFGATVETPTGRDQRDQGKGREANAKGKG